MGRGGCDERLHVALPIAGQGNGTAVDELLAGQARFPDGQPHSRLPPEQRAHRFFGNGLLCLISRSANMMCTDNFG